MIKLNFRNESNDQNNAEIVIFQKNVSTNFEETAIAWKVIKNCAPGDYHPFDFPEEVQISATDSWGNYTPQINAIDGQLFHVFTDRGGGTRLAYEGPAASPKEIEMRNDLSKGAISANIYKDGKLLATKQNIAAGQQAVFEFIPIIWIGVVSQFEEGEIIDQAVLSDINTEFNLIGIASADIIMRGGGAGPNATEFTFKLDNIIYK